MTNKEEINVPLTYLNNLCFGFHRDFSYKQIFGCIEIS